MEAAAPLAFFNHRVQHCAGFILEAGFVQHLESAISEFKRLVESTKPVCLPALTQQHVDADADAEVVEADMEAEAVVAAE